MRGSNGGGFLMGGGIYGGKDDDDVELEGHTVGVEIGEETEN